MSAPDVMERAATCMDAAVTAALEDAQAHGFPAQLMPSGVPPSRQPLVLRLVLRGAPGSFAKGLPVPASAQPCKSLLAALRRHDRRACGVQGAATTSRCSRTARRRCSRRRSRRGARARLRCSAPTCSLPRRPSPASASGAGARARPRWQRRSCVSRVGPPAYPCRAAQASDGLARACKPSA